MFLAQLRNELWKLFGKKRTYIGFGAFLLAQVLMLLIFKFTGWQGAFERMIGGNGYVPSEFISALSVSLVMLLPQLLFLMPLYATLVGGDMVAKESEDGTLRMILCRPISRIRLLWVKWIAGCIFGAVLVIALGATALAFARIAFPWGGLFVSLPREPFSAMPADEGLLRFVFAHLFLAVNASTMVSIAFMFSCFNMKPAAATIVALTLLFITFVLEQIPFFDRYDQFFITHHFHSGMLVFYNPIDWSRVFHSEVILVAVNITAFIVGAMAFQVRDIKS